MAEIKLVQHNFEKLSNFDYFKIGFFITQGITSYLLLLRLFVALFERLLG